MQIRFLGTGAADWHGPDERGEWRRLSSLLVERDLLIDFTQDKSDLIDSVRTVLITHSHSDHFDPMALAKLHPERVYVHESWLEDARQTGLPVYGFAFGESFEREGIRITPVPANHTTEKPYEEACGYLLEKDGKRFLYMTDTAWLPRKASILIGNTPLDAIAFDATIGPAYPRDYRIFEHTSYAMAQMMTDGLLATGCLRPQGRVYLTHMARTLWPTQREAETLVQTPFIAAKDGMTAEI